MKSKMFKTITRTWNVFTGCKFDCTYCWVDNMIIRLLKAGNTKYKTIGKTPTFHAEEMKKHFKPGEFIFVAAMGDISFSPWQYEVAILEKIKAYPDTKFLLQTKDPSFYLNGHIKPDNVYTGATLETNRPIIYSKAPATIERYHSMAMLKHPHKFISIEPVMDFDLEIFSTWIIDISPEIVEIGADNYHNNLPEPSWAKIKALIIKLKEAGIQVKEKDGLNRLRQGVPEVA